MSRRLICRSAASIPSNQRGVSLVETLVALVVLSVGMLGIAALYLETLRSGRTALLRSQAVTLATDMADRIRANPAAREAYEKGVDDAGSENAACETTGFAAGCDAAVMAAHDTAVWYQAVDGRSQSITSLPDGRGEIEVDPSPIAGLTSYVIRITWSEVSQANPNTYELRIEV